MSEEKQLKRLVSLVAKHGYQVSFTTTSPAPPLGLFWSNSILFVKRGEIREYPYSKSTCPMCHIKEDQCKQVADAIEKMGIEAFMDGLLQRFVDHENSYEFHDCGTLAARDE